MLNFKELALSDKDIINEFFRKENFYSAKYDFAACYVWRNIYNFKYCIEDGFLFIQTAYHKDIPYFMCPIGEGDFAAAVSKIREYAEKNNIRPMLFCVFEYQKEKLLSCFKDVTFTENRSEEDYVYLREDLAELKGKKYHSKRNFLSRFKHGNWRYESMNSQNIPLCIKMHEKWLKTTELSGDLKSIEEDHLASLEALNNFEALGLKGGVLYLDNEVCAYSIGNYIGGSCFVVHFEKAFGDIIGAYAAINNETVLNEAADAQFINREDDTGDLGLRQAKLSYHPYEIIKEYIACFGE